MSMYPQKTNESILSGNGPPFLSQPQSMTSVVKWSLLMNDQTKKEDILNAFHSYFSGMSIPTNTDAPGIQATVYGRRSAIQPNDQSVFLGFLNATLFYKEMRKYLQNLPPLDGHVQYRHSVAEGYINLIPQEFDYNTYYLFTGKSAGIRSLVLVRMTEEESFVLAFRRVPAKGVQEKRTNFFLMQNLDRVFSDNEAQLRDMVLNRTKKRFFVSSYNDYDTCFKIILHIFANNLDLPSDNIALLQHLSDIAQESSMYIPRNFQKYIK